MRKLTPDEAQVLQRLYLAYPAPIGSVDLQRELRGKLAEEPKKIRLVVKALIKEGYAEMVRDLGRSYEVMITLPGVEYLRQFHDVHFWGEMPGRSPWKTGYRDGYKSQG